MASRGWFYFLFGLLISSFFGGAFHVFFSEARVRAFVESVVQRKQPKFDIEFKSARIKFAGEFWPTIAVELSGIDIRAKDSCVTNSSLFIDNISVPFELSSFFSEKVRFGHVHAASVRFFNRPKSCVAEDNPPVANIDIDEVANFEKFFKRRWSKEVVNTTRYLKKFTIDKLEIINDAQVLTPAIIENLETQFDKDRKLAEMKANIRLGAPWIGQTPFSAFNTLVIVREDEVQFMSSGSLKEGQIQIDGKWSVERGELRLDAQTRDIPASGAITLLQHRGILTTLKPLIKNQWLNCDLSLVGDIRKFMQLPLKLHQCRLYGDFGEIKVKTEVVSSLSSGGDVHLFFQNLDVKKALTAFDLARPWGHIARFGVFSGEVIALDAQNLKIDGEVRDLEFYILNFKNRERINITNFNILLQHNGAQLIGQANNFNVKDGQVEAVVSFNFDSQQSGKFRIAANSLNFSVDSHRNIWGGFVSNASLKGEGEFLQSALKSFNGEIKFSDLKTLNWSLMNISAGLHFQNATWAIQGQADHFLLQPESKWKGPLLSLLAEGSSIQSAVPKEHSLAQITGFIELQPTGGRWQNVKARTSDFKNQIQSSGKWNESMQLDGEIKMTTNKLVIAKKVAGNFKAPQIKTDNLQK